MSFPPTEPLSPAPDAEGDERPETVPVSPAALDSLVRRLAGIEEAMRREHERAAHREQVIDRLHAENQDLRHGLLQEALTPVRTALYRLYDTAAREAARWRGREPPPAERVASLLEAIADEVAEVLGRAGAELLPVEPGDAYDPVVHRPVRTRPVPPAEDGTVVEVLTEGFVSVTAASLGAPRERVVRKAGVVVGRAPAGETAADSGPTDQAARVDEGEG
jgi:molecular chaperone GrpE (heat shock protein)